MYKKYNLSKVAYKRIRDRGINWKERYRQRSIQLKRRFDKDIGPMAYLRWEGHDYTTDSDYFVVAGPAMTKDLKKRFLQELGKCLVIQELKYMLQVENIFLH